MSRIVRPSLPALCAALSLAACGAPPPEAESDPRAAAQPAAVSASEKPAAPGPARTPAAPAQAPRWQAAASGEGDALFLPGPGGGRLVTLFCPARTEDLLVNVRDFRPIGSEERMSFGSGNIAVTMVADARGDQERGGVTGRGRLPDELAAILSGPEGLAVNYGAQNSGPHAPPGPEAARRFLQGCRD